MDPLKIARSVAGQKASDVLRKEADEKMLLARQTQFTAAMRLGGKHTAEGRRWLADAEVLRVDAKQLEAEAAGARDRANRVLYRQASQLIKDARRKR